MIHDDDALLKTLVQQAQAIADEFKLMSERGFSDLSRFPDLIGRYVAVRQEINHSIFARRSMITDLNPNQRRLLRNVLDRRGTLEKFFRLMEIEHFPLSGGESRLDKLGTEDDARRIADDLFYSKTTLEEVADRLAKAGVLIAEIHGLPHSSEYTELLERYVEEARWCYALKNFNAVSCLARAILERTAVHLWELDGIGNTRNNISENHQKAIVKAERDIARIVARNKLLQASRVDQIHEVLAKLYKTVTGGPSYTGKIKQVSERLGERKRDKAVRLYGKLSKNAHGLTAKAAADALREVLRIVEQLHDASNRVSG